MQTNSMAADEQQKDEMVNWSHACPYCTKSFESSQALGGHQNAHRRERDADRLEYLATRRAQRMSTSRTIMVAAHHGIRSSGLPMLPHGASLYGSPSSDYRYFSAYGNGYNVVGVPVQGACPYCRRWFGGEQMQQHRQGAPVEYKFIPCYEEINLLGSSSSVVSSAASVIVLDQQEHEAGEENRSDEHGRLDLTLRL